jgi:hypothetical protein
MKRRGLVYVAFSQPYLEAARHSVTALRRYSSLPVLVLTDVLPTEQSSLWQSLLDTKLQVIDGRDPLQNRRVKTQLYRYTPFDETLYCDCDTVVRSPRFMEAFDILAACDICFPVYTRQESDERLKTPVYRETLVDFGLHGQEPTLWVYQGGVYCFRNTAAPLFDLWSRCWQKRQFRDMPPLVVAVHTIKGVSVGWLPRGFGFPDSDVIQHFYGWKPPVSRDMPVFRKMRPDERTHRWRWDPT